MNSRIIRELLTFTERERKGIIALLILIFIFTVVNILLPYFYKDRSVDISAWEKEVDEYLAHVEKEEKPSFPVKMVSFDPNTVSLNQLKSFGIPTRVGENWIKYIEKGGRFKRKEEVMKIYGMDSTMYSHLEDFLIIPEKEKGKVFVEMNSYDEKRTALIPKDSVYKKSSPDKYPKKIITAVDVNLADSASLEQLPGIGPVFAARIVRYRKLLGGFHSVSQLHDVYGLGEENYQKALPYLNIDGGECQKFNINFSTIQELGRHPYVGYKTARKIIDVRDKKGKFVSVDNLSAVMSEDSLKKLAPYLSFGN